MIHSHQILCVVFDSEFNFRQHISQVCKSCFYHIRDLRRIRRHLSISTAKTISTALISSRLHYCNSPLNNISKRVLASLLHLSNIYRQLRSSITQLIVPKTKPNFDKRAFSVAAPRARVWNELPITLKTSEAIAIFRKKFKIYLFQIAFQPLIFGCPSF